MRDNGYDDDEIRLALGYVPPDLSAEEWDEMFGVDDFSDLTWGETDDPSDVPAPHPL